MPWGTNVNLFLPKIKNTDKLIFFHSVGMSKRKGTDLLINAFIQGKIFNKSKLIIHSQIGIEKNFGYKANYLKKHNIEVIEKTVAAPGLYYLGDVYVYPTTLDGLGLTIYEALACGLPVITTNCAPMNEIITDEVGYLVNVEEYRTRSDAYYWPLSYCSIESLIESMQFFIDNFNILKEYKFKARTQAEKYYNWNHSCPR